MVTVQSSHIAHINDQNYLQNHMKQGQCHNDKKRKGKAKGTKLTKKKQSNTQSPYRDVFTNVRELLVCFLCNP